MLKLMRNLKPFAWMLVVIIILVTGQAVAELYLPEKMSEIINDGIFIDYEYLYKHLEMERPSSISGVDSEKTLKGYDSETIPVFEMADGFSTYDLTAAINENENTNINTVFRDIPAKDSKELFDNIITPFLEGLKPYQRIAYDYRNANFAEDSPEYKDFEADYNASYYTAADRAAIAEVINALLIFDGTNHGVNGSIKVSSNKDSDITVNSLLSQDPYTDEDAMANESNRKILTGCISCMKHSVYGNLMPVPLDKDGNRLPTDEYGQALEPHKLVYIYSNKDGDEVPSAEKSYTGRPDEMPDYETIICNNVLGYSYKFKGSKWIDHKRGTTDQNAQEAANKYNSELLFDALVATNKYNYSEEQRNTIMSMLDNLVVYYTSSDDLILLQDLIKYTDKPYEKVMKKLSLYYSKDDNGKTTTVMLNSKWRQFWLKLGNYLTLNATGTQIREIEDNNKDDSKDKIYTFSTVKFRTAKDMMLPDGESQQAKDMNFVLKRGAYMLGLTLLACACAITVAVLSSKLASEFSAITREKVFRRVERYSLIEFDRFSTSSLITRSTNDVNQIQTVFLLIMRTALIAPITLVGGMIMSWQKSFYMTAVIFYDLPILIISAFIAMKFVQPLFKVVQKKIDRLTLITREGLTGIRVIRAFNKQEHENERFGKINRSLTRTSTTIAMCQAILAPLIAVVMNCSIVGIVWRASNQIAFNEDIEVGDMMAVIQYMTQIMMALVMLANVYVQFPRASASASRINEVLETENMINDPETPNTNYTSSGTVKFRNVNFKYTEDAEKNILTGIDFTAERGKVTAIVGGTGSGKSTVINLIPRFYDVTEGEILLNGVNVKEIPQKELREMIGFVPQRSMLFSGTIADNLRFGKKDATDEEIWEALKIAQSAAFVSEKENKIESHVEQGGQNFSGGQKQRLSIARAIIKKPDVLIFDDSFSALDCATDARLRTALKQITSQSATIIVAQRIGTIMDADNILVLHEGRIVGQGTHDHLIKNCEVYRDIALSQLSAEELGL